MGVMKRLNQEGARIRRKPRRPGSVRSMTSVLVSDMDMIEHLLAQLPVAFREKAVKKAVRAGMRKYISAARKRAPDGSVTGTSAKKSTKQKNRDANRRFNLKKSLGVKVKGYGMRVAAFGGPRRPDGNHAHLVEYGHEKVLWGRKTSGEVKGRPFLRPAAEESRFEQRSAMLKTLQKEIKKV